MADFFDTTITGDLTVSGNITSSLNGYVFHGYSSSSSSADNYGMITTSATAYTYTTLPIKTVGTEVTSNSPIVSGVCTGDTSAGTVTFNYSGTYIVFARLNYNCATASKRVQFSLFKNGSREAWSTNMLYCQVGSGNECVVVTYPVWVEANDYISIGACCTDSVAVNALMYDIVIMKV